MGNKPWEMYDLSQDPYETNDLAKQMPEKLAEMMQIYKQERANDAE